MNMIELRFTIVDLRLIESGLVIQEQVTNIYKDANEITAMTVAFIKTLRNRKSKIGN